jgi:hypothetical protein
MSSKATSIKSAVADFMVKHGISREMEQNLIKEAIHLQMSDAGLHQTILAASAELIRRVVLPQLQE